MEENVWAIVELMGHKVVAGKVSKSELVGPPKLRVDVPATSAFPEFTQLYGDAAIYCVTFVSEDVARRTAEANKTNPVSVYVPDLVTREQLEETIKKYKEQITFLRALPQATVDRDAFMRDDETDEDKPPF
jgi:arylsulfatase A-like enzyme